MMLRVIAKASVVVAVVWTDHSADNRAGLPGPAPIVTERFGSESVASDAEGGGERPERDVDERRALPAGPRGSNKESERT